MLRNVHETEDEEISVPNRFFNLLILGIALVFVGIAILIVVSAVFGSSGSIGGVILIGPIPIIFGLGPNAIWLILIGIVLTILSIAIFLVIYRQSERPRD
jgi:uncharacterized membrane protein